MSCINELHHYKSDPHVILSSICHWPIVMCNIHRRYEYTRAVATGTAGTAMAVPVFDKIANKFEQILLIPFIELIS